MDAPVPTAPLAPRRKILALDPRVRDEICTHAHVAWSGRVPCTGDLICTMCGARGEELTAPMVS